MYSTGIALFRPSPISGLMEPQWISVVNKVAQNHCQKTFDYYCPADISQEIWIIALKAAPAFKMPKAKVDSLPEAVEHWLNRVVSTRLTNLYRDRYAIKRKALKKDKSEYDVYLRGRMASAGSLGEAALEVSAGKAADAFSVVSEKEEWDNFYNNLDENSAEVLQALLEGMILPSYYKSRLIKDVREVIDNGEKANQNNEE